MRKLLTVGLLLGLPTLTGCQWDDMKTTMAKPFETNIHGVPRQSEPPLDDTNTKDVSTE